MPIETSQKIKKVDVEKYDFDRALHHVHVNMEMDAVELKIELEQLILLLDQVTKEKDNIETSAKKEEQKLKQRLKIAKSCLIATDVKLRETELVHNQVVEEKQALKSALLTSQKIHLVSQTTSAELAEALDHYRSSSQREKETTEKGIMKLQAALTASQQHTSDLQIDLDKVRVSLEQQQQQQQNDASRIQSLERDLAAAKQTSADFAIQLDSCERLLTATAKDAANLQSKVSKVEEREINLVSMQKENDCLNKILKKEFEMSQSALVESQKHAVELRETVKHLQFLLDQKNAVLDEQKDIVITKKYQAETNRTRRMTIVLRRLESRLLLKTYLKWMHDWHQKKRVRNFVRHWLRRSQADAFDMWINFIEERVQTRRLMVRVLARMQRVQLVRGFISWTLFTRGFQWMDQVILLTESVQEQKNQIISMNEKVTLLTELVDHLEQQLLSAHGDTASAVKAALTKQENKHQQFLSGLSKQDQQRALLQDQYKRTKNQEKKIIVSQYTKTIEELEKNVQHSMEEVARLKMLENHAKSYQTMLIALGKETLQYDEMVMQMKIMMRSMKMTRVKEKDTRDVSLVTVTRKNFSFHFDADACKIEPPLEMVEHDCRVRHKLEKNRVVKCELETEHGIVQYSAASLQHQAATAALLKYERSWTEQSTPESIEPLLVNVSESRTLFVRAATKYHSVLSNEMNARISMTEAHYRLTRTKSRLRSQRMRLTTSCLEATRAKEMTERLASNIKIGMKNLKEQLHEEALSMPNESRTLTERKRETRRKEKHFDAAEERFGKCNISLERALAAFTTAVREEEVALTFLEEVDEVGDVEEVAAQRNRWVSARSTLFAAVQKCSHAQSEEVKSLIELLVAEKEKSLAECDMEAAESVLTVEAQLDGSERMLTKTAQDAARLRIQVADLQRELEEGRTAWTKTAQDAARLRSQVADLQREREEGKTASTKTAQDAAEMSFTDEKDKNYAAEMAKVVTQVENLKVLHQQEMSVLIISMEKKQKKQLEDLKNKHEKEMIAAKENQQKNMAEQIQTLKLTHTTSKEKMKKKLENKHALSIGTETSMLLVQHEAASKILQKEHALEIKSLIESLTWKATEQKRDAMNQIKKLENKANEAASPIVANVPPMVRCWQWLAIAAVLSTTTVFALVFTAPESVGLVSIHKHTFLQSNLTDTKRKLSSLTRFSAESAEAASFSAMNTLTIDACELTVVSAVNERNRNLEEACTQKLELVAKRQKNNVQKLNEEMKNLQARDEKKYQKLKNDLIANIASMAELKGQQRKVATNSRTELEAEQTKTMKEMDELKRQYKNELSSMKKLMEKEHSALLKRMEEEHLKEKKIETKKNETDKALNKALRARTEKLTKELKSEHSKELKILEESLSTTNIKHAREMESMRGKSKNAIDKIEKELTVAFKNQQGKSLQLLESEHKANMLKELAATKDQDKKRSSVALEEAANDHAEKIMDLTAKLKDEQVNVVQNLQDKHLKEMSKIKINGKNAACNRTTQELMKGQKAAFEILKEKMIYEHQEEMMSAEKILKEQLNGVEEQAKKQMEESQKGELRSTSELSAQAEKTRDELEKKLKETNTAMEESHKQELEKKKQMVKKFQMQMERKHKRELTAKKKESEKLLKELNTTLTQLAEKEEAQLIMIREQQHQHQDHLVSMSELERLHQASLVVMEQQYKTKESATLDAAEKKHQLEKEQIQSDSSALLAKFDKVKAEQAEQAKHERQHKHQHEHQVQVAEQSAKLKTEAINEETEKRESVLKLTHTSTLSKLQTRLIEMEQSNQQKGEETEKIKKMLSESIDKRMAAAKSNEQAVKRMHRGKEQEMLVAVENANNVVRKKSMADRRKTMASMKEEFKKYTSELQTNHDLATGVLAARLKSQHQVEIGKIPRATETEIVLMKRIGSLENQLKAFEQSGGCVPGMF